MQVTEWTCDGDIADGCPASGASNEVGIPIEIDAGETRTFGVVGIASGEEDATLLHPFPLLIPPAYTDNDAGNDIPDLETAISGAKPNLTLTRTATPDPVVAGNNLSLAFTAHNPGGLVANDVTITVPVPGGYGLVGGPGCALAAATLTCGLGDMPPENGKPASERTGVAVNATLKTPPGAVIAPLTLVAVASFDGDDPTPDDSESTSDTLIIGSADHRRRRHRRRAR